MLVRKSRQARDGDAPFKSRKKDISRANESRQYLPGLLVGSRGCDCSAIMGSESLIIMVSESLINSDLMIAGWIKDSDPMIGSRTLTP